MVYEGGGGLKKSKKLSTWFMNDPQAIIPKVHSKISSESSNIDIYIDRIWVILETSTPIW